MVCRSAFFESALESQWYLLAHSLQKVQSEEMVADIPSVKGQRSIIIAQLGSLYVDLTVLHNLVAVVIATDHTHSLGRLYLLYYL